MRKGDKKMNDLNFIGKIQNELYLYGGFSFNLEYGFNPPKEGYMVGGIGNVLKFDSIEELSKGKEKILDLLNTYGNQSKNIFLGGWVKENKVFIEPSEIFFNFSIAFHEAEQESSVFESECPLCGNETFYNVDFLMKKEILIPVD